MNTTSQNNWKIFNSTADHFEISFPDEVQEVRNGETVQWVSKDSAGNLYAVQRFIPDPEIINGQSSKDMLRTAIKVLVMKDNVKLNETTYSEYLGETVAVDFSGQITNQPFVGRPFKGKIILDNNYFYYLYAVLENEDSVNLENYQKFILSFKLID